jgi:hypothetical protein
MSSTQSPCVFVSSTCFDLEEVRDQLRQFIESFGFDPMLSDFRSFPVSPLNGPVENCRRNVETHADIFVLVVGNRYGNTVDSGKSITNIEYLAARAKGIPIYVFVSRTILDLLPVWKKNPGATFPGVDSPKLFEFVDSLHGPRDIWIYPFDKADDITRTLRRQWAYLFMESLQLWTRANNSGLSSLQRQLPGPALRLVIEKPQYWEYRLFSIALADNLAAFADKKRDLQSRLAFGRYERIEPQELPGWVGCHFMEMSQKVGMINRIFEPGLQQEAFGPPGTPGNPDRILWLADRIAALYGELIDWSLRSLRVQTDDEFRPLLEIVAKFNGNAILEVENFATEFKRSIDEIVENPPAQGESRVISLCLKLTIREGLPEQLDHELKRLTPLIARRLAEG